MSTAGSETAMVTVRRAPRWMWIVLLLSFSINLLIAGIVIGSVWAVNRGGYWNAATKIERNFRFMRALPAEQRVEIRQIFRKHKPDLAPYWRDVREARMRIGRLVRTGSSSRDELQAAMDDLFRKEMQARQAAKPMLSEMLSQLTEDEKLRFLRVFMPYLDDAQSRMNVRLPQP